MIQVRASNGAVGRCRRRGGFTLVEAIATLVVLGVLAGATAPMMVESIDGYAAATTHAQLHAEVSLALDRVTRELRNVAADPDTGGPESHLALVRSTRIEYNDDDALWLDGTDLRIRSGGSNATLLRDVVAFELTSYDEDNQKLAENLAWPATAPVRRVQVDLTASRHGVAEKLRARVFLRAARLPEESP